MTSAWDDVWGTPMLYAIDVSRKQVTGHATMLVIAHIRSPVNQEINDVIKLPLWSELVG